MEIISFHTNQNSYPIGTKNTIIRPPPPLPPSMLYVLRRRSRKFENVDDGRRIPAYTII